MECTPDLTQHKYILKLTMLKWYELLKCEKAKEDLIHNGEELYFQDMRIERIPKDKLKVTVYEKDGRVTTRYDDYLEVLIDKTENANG